MGLDLRVLCVTAFLSLLAFAVTPNTDAADRAYNVNGSSYFRPQWFFNFSQSSGIWFQQPYSVLLDNSATNDAVLDTSGAHCPSSADPVPAASLQSGAKGCLRLTTYQAGQNSGQNGVILVRQNLLPGGTGDSIRFKMRLKFGSVRAESEAGSGFGVYYMRKSEYDTLTTTSQAFNWQSRCEANKPEVGFGVAMRTRTDGSAAANRGFSLRYAPLEGSSLYKYRSTPSAAVRTEGAASSVVWRDFEAKLNHSRITVKWDEVDQFVGTGTPPLTVADLTHPGSMNTSSGEDWVFLVGASGESPVGSKPAFLDTQIIDNLEISYWTKKRVPQPPEHMQFVSSTSGSVTFTWTPNPDDGGSPVSHYSINATSFNASCSDSNDGVQSYGCAYDVKTTCNLTTSEYGVATGGPCTVSGLRRATQYYIEMSGHNVVGQGPWQRAVGYSRLLVGVQPGIPDPPTSVRVVSRGINYVDLAWNATTQDGGSPVNNYRIKINHFQGPYIHLAMNLAPPAVNTQESGNNNLYFRVTGLFRLSNYTFQVACDNSFTRNGVNYGYWSNYSLPSPMITTLPTVPTAPTFLSSSAPITQGWDIQERPIPPNFCWTPCRHKLHWTTPADDGGYPIIGYRVFPVQYPTTEWTDVSYRSNASSLETGTNSLIIDGLLRDVTYSWFLKATTRIGDGAASAASSLRTLSSPETRDLALGMNVSQSGNWFTDKNFAASAVDSNLDGDVKTGSVAVTDNVPYPWWRVAFTPYGEQKWITKIRAYSCTLFEDPAVGQWGCNLKFYDLDIRILGGTRVKFPVDSSVAYLTEFNPNPTRANQGLHVGAIGDEVVIQSRIQQAFLAIAEVRVLGWDLGCPEEYTCLNGGTCVNRKDGMEHRKCECLEGYSGYNCATRLTTTWGRAAEEETSKSKVTASTGQYVLYATLSLFIMGGVWVVCLGGIYLYWKFVGMDAESGIPSAQVIPANEERNALSHQYAVRTQAVAAYRAKLGLGGSSAAKKARAKSRSRSQAENRQRQERSLARVAPEFWMPEEKSDPRGGVEEVSMYGGGFEEEDVPYRRPPCGMSIGLWRLMKDRGKFVICFGFALGVAFFMIMVLSFIMG